MEANGVEHGIIIGAMKAGTTSLYQMLVQHPQICGARNKEPNYFCKEEMLSYEADGISYQDLWVPDSNTKILLEASTGYTKYPMNPGVPSRLHSYGIEAKLIYVVRDPLSRIESHFNYMRNKTDGSIGILTEDVVAVSKYGMQISEWLRFSKISDLHVIDHSLLKTDPIPVLRDAFRFLGVSQDIEVELRETNVTTNWSPLRKLVFRSKHRAKLRYIPNSIKHPIRDLADELYTNRGRFRRLTVRERTILFNELADDMALFRDLTGFPVEKWGFSYSSSQDCRGS